MKDTSKEDRERLERFLEWDRARRRAVRRRSLRYVGGMAFLGVVAVGLVAWLTHEGGDTQGRVDVELRRGGAPAEDVGAVSDGSRAALTRGAPPAAVESLPEAPKADRHDTAPHERGPGSDGARVAARATSRPGRATEPRALPRSPSPPPRAPADPNQRPDVAAPGAPSAPPAASITSPSETPAPMVSTPPNETTATREAPGTRGEPITAIAPAAAPPLPPPTVAAPQVPTPTPATPPSPSALQPDVADPWPDRVATLKRWVGYIPEVRLGKAIVRWVKSQPPPESEPSPSPSPSTPPQAR